MTNFYFKHTKIKKEITYANVFTKSPRVYKGENLH